MTSPSLDDICKDHVQIRSHSQEMVPSPSGDSIQPTPAPERCQAPRRLSPPPDSPAPKSPPLVLPPYLQDTPLIDFPITSNEVPRELFFLTWPHDHRPSFRHSLPLPCPGLLRNLPTAWTRAGCALSLLTVMSAVGGRHAIHMKGRTLS